MEQKDKTFTVVIFFINGINSLIAWNTVLAGLDFFANSFSEYNVYSFLPVPLFVAYLLMGILYHDISNRFKYVSLIIVGNIIVNIAMVAILVFTIVFKQQLIGFILMLVSSFVIGIGANTSQLTFFAMINYLSQNIVSKYTVGTAASGLLITIIRAIITAIFGSDDDSVTPIIIYFAITLALNTFNIFLNIRFCRSSVYKHKIDHFLVHRDVQKEGIQPAPGTQLQKTVEGPINKENHEEKTQNQKDQNDPDTEKSEELESSYVDEEKRIEEQSYFRTLLETGKQIQPYPLMILLNFVITFTLYPGPTFTRTFSDIGDSWKVIIFNLFYNIGDTVGKYVAGIPKIFNSKSLIFTFFSRLYFFFPVTFMAMALDSNDSLTNNNYYPFLNIFLFAFTNGFVINGSFIMAFQVCPLAFKKYAGVLCGLFLQLGIMLGVIVEIPYSYIIGIN